MSRRQARARRTRTTPDAQMILRQVQKALAVAACIRIAVDCGEEDSLDTADAIAGLPSLLEAGSVDELMICNEAFQKGGGIVNDGVVVPV